MPTDANAPPREWFRFYTPSECRNYTPPEGQVLVGDNHIVRGGITVIAGPPGVGKSRAGHSLAIAGKTQKDWFGLKVHRTFKTAILQNENGRLRLKDEFTQIGVDGLDDFIRISAPPNFGMAFDQVEFRFELAKWLETWRLDLVIFDPWNSAARDDGQRDYHTLFGQVRFVLPKGPLEPALVIIAHTRKPKADERNSGRDLLHDVSGSHVLVSVPRTVFIMQPATNDTSDERVVWTCVKNNDGSLGERSVWLRRHGLFVPCSDFDWKNFGQPVKATNHTITWELLNELFDSGKRKLTLKEAVSELEQRGFQQTARYAALQPEGRFKEHLSRDQEGVITWTP